MADEINIVDLLEEPSEDLKKQLTEPYKSDFVETESRTVEIEPEQNDIDKIKVDVANNNIDFFYTFRSSNERYRVVVSEPDISMVESKTYVNAGEAFIGSSKLYYAVLDEQVFLRDPGWQGYEKVDNPFVMETAELAPGFYEQGIEKYGPDPVPPPENDEIFSE